MKNENHTKEELTYTPNELADFLCDNFTASLPENPFSFEGLKEIGDLLTKSSSEYSYLVNLLSYSKIQCRELKRKGKDFKIEYEDAVDRKTIIENALNSVEILYKTCSRLITVRQEINQENKMNDFRKEQ